MKRNVFQQRSAALLLLIALALSACTLEGQGQAQPTATKPQPAAQATAQPQPGATFTLPPSPTQEPAPSITPDALAFDGDRAYQDVITQVEFGPRLPESEAHAKTVDWIQENLKASGWEVELQETTRMDHPVRNVIAKRGTGQPWVILGAHYDSRIAADQDAANPESPVPGANDGASGVAVLLELARVLPKDLDKQVWLVFFDVEDQGRLPGWDWILGSRAFAESLQGTPDSVIVVDMIGDANLNILKEQNSDQQLTDDIWQAAEERGHNDVFIPEIGYSILDDHTPFLEKGLRAIDIIDFDYPYWHTLQDTPDKVAPDSLFAVGDTLLHWLMK